MKVAFILTCRNKASFVRNTVRGMLAQTYSPMEIVLSDQGSTDGSREILAGLAQDYRGPNTVRVIDCPHTEYKGMIGLNAHLNWIHSEVDADIFVQISADDICHADRVKKIVEVFEKHNPSFVGTAQYFMKPSGEITGRSDDKFNGFVDPVTMIETMIGSSGSQAWSRDLYEKYGPLQNLESEDVLLPFFACFERGFYHLNEVLHAYVQHASEDNTGLEGVLRSYKEGTADHWAGVELVNYHFVSNWFAVLRKLNALVPKADRKVIDAIVTKLIECGNAWAIARDNLTIKRIQPHMMKV